MLPNPVIYFNGFINRLPGAMITASHNPPEYNGFKFFRANGSSYTDELQKLKEIIRENKFKGDGKSAIVDIDYGLTDYRDFLDRGITVEKKIKVVAECFNGVASTIVPYIFDTFGMECIPIHNQIKGDFGGLRPEPKGENLNELRKKVVQEKADFGIAFDGDADRSVFIDDKGNEYMASVAGTIFIRDILSRTKGEIIATVDCPSSIAKTVEEYGGKIFWNRIGHGFIEESLVKRKALFAVEQSSHFYFNQFYPFSDGFLAGLRMAEILSKSEKKFSELAGEMERNPTEKIYIDAGTHEKKDKTVENLKKQFPEAIDAVDGFKTLLNDTEWVLIRTSQNMPEVNLVIEAKDNKRLKELLEKYTKLIKDEIRKV
jgi:phosphomannomutase/phosphoglucomutase